MWNQFVDDGGENSGSGSSLVAFSHHFSPPSSRTHTPPPLPLLQLPLQLKGFLSDMQMFFMGDLPVEYCRVKLPFIHGGGGTRTNERLVSVRDTWSWWA